MSPQHRANARTSTAVIVERLRTAGSVFAEEEAALLIDATSSDAALDDLVARRVAGEPLELVVGWAAFGDLRITVAPGVFIPRRRSEPLAAAAIERVHPGAVAVDLCCGAGPLAAALLAAEPSLEVHAADIDPVATACARANLPGDAHVHTGDLYDALPRALAGTVDVIVANAPYVPTGALALLPAEARLHEPATSLDGGEDGLAIHRRIAADAPRWLRVGGHLLIEVAVDQVDAAIEMMTTTGLSTSVERDDELETNVVAGSLTPPR